MRGACAWCREQQARGIADACCAECVVWQAGWFDYLTHQPDGTMVLDLEQKIKDEAHAHG